MEKRYYSLCYLVLLVLTSTQHISNEKEDKSIRLKTTDIIPNNGIYKSSENSFRSNFYLKKDGDSITLFGWEPLEQDTVYYKSTAKINLSPKNGFDFRLHKFEFSFAPVLKDDLNAFIPAANADKQPLFLHNSFRGEISGNILRIWATKDSYDSRADEFEFVRIN